VSSLKALNLDNLSIVTDPHCHRFLCIFSMCSWLNSVIAAIVLKAIPHFRSICIWPLTVLLSLCLCLIVTVMMRVTATSNWWVMSEEKVFDRFYIYFDLKSHKMTFDTYFLETTVWIFAKMTFEVNFLKTADKWWESSPKITNRLSTQEQYLLLSSS